MVEPRAGVLGEVLQADADLAGALGCFGFPMVRCELMGKRIFRKRQGAEKLGWDGYARVPTSFAMCP